MRRTIIGFKALAILAAWVIVIWWFSVAPPDDLSLAEILTNITIAVAVGCLYSTVIILLNRQNIGRAATTAFFAILFSFLAVVFGDLFVLSSLYGYDHGMGLAQSEKSTFVAAVAGAILGSILSELDFELRFGRKQIQQDEASDKPLQ